jgi:O-acetyl-ADP-ribose deacetylase (regulator of RNase III)
LLRDTIFNEPAKPADEKKIRNVWGYGIPWRHRDQRQQQKSIKVASFTSGKEIELLLGDITKMKVDAVVSSDDNYLSMGGGVSEAIRKAGGRLIRKETRKYIPAELGAAITTSAGRLYAKYVIHAVVIDFDQNIWPDADIVQMATESCLNEADGLGCRTIAMPALGTGAGRLDVEEVVYAMIDEIFSQLENKQNLQKVFIVLYREDRLFDYLKASFERKTFYV